MVLRDVERTEKIRIAVRYLLERGTLGHGSQTRLAEHFRISRQRVHQIVAEERVRGQVAPSQGCRSNDALCGSAGIPRAG
ncbi:MAG: hypothetical protein M3P30_16370 [Chloroflexota bacterium]|nr:hypothetical protein [Chloroflexota bacterium]